MKQEKDYQKYYNQGFSDFAKGKDAYDNPTFIDNGLRSAYLKGWNAAFHASPKTQKGNGWVK